MRTMINLRKDRNLYALLIKPDGTFKPILVNGIKDDEMLDFKYKHIECELVDCICADEHIGRFVTAYEDVPRELDYWFDEEFLYTHDTREEKPNKVASILCRTVIYGNMMAMLSDDEGKTIGMHREAVDALMGICKIAWNSSITLF